MAVLFTVMLILIIAGLVASTAAFTGLDTLVLGSSQQQGNQAILAGESCVDEALLRLGRDPSYVGGALSVGETQCTISIVGNPCGACVISVTAQKQFFTRRLEVNTTVTDGAITVDQWQELD